MKTKKSENVYKYIYGGAMWVMAVSVVMMFFIKGVTPFGVSTSWSTDGVGSSLILMRSEALVAVGDRVATRAISEKGVSTFVVDEVLDQEGVLYYVSSNTSAGSVAVLASNFSKSVLLSVPFVGIFVQMLSNVFGVMFFIGLPLTMLLINYAMFFAQKFALVSSFEPQKFVKTMVSTTVSAFESRKKVGQKREKAGYDVKDIVKGMREQYRGDTKSGFVTVLKPYNLQQRYSH